MSTAATRIPITYEGSWFYTSYAQVIVLSVVYHLPVNAESPRNRFLINFSAFLTSF